jgi:hypothetical protein
MTSRQEKLALLTRTNRGRIITPSFLAALSEALGESIGPSALSSLPETDALREAFRAGYVSAVKDGVPSYRRFFPQEAVKRVFHFADCLADQLRDEQGLFLTKLSSDCGAIGVGVSILLRHAVSVIDFDGDCLSAMSTDRTQGILIDHNPDDTNQTYEVAVWGDRWSLLALACDS